MMLLSPYPQHYCYHHHHHSPYRNPNFTTATKRLNFTTISASYGADITDTAVTTTSSTVSDDSKQFFRKHNAKSLAILHEHLSPKRQEDRNEETENLQDDNNEDDDKVTLLKLSLLAKRTPQFPGSIYVQSPSDVDVSSSLPPLKNVFRGGSEGDDDVDADMVMRAIDIRRKVTTEIFKEAMRKGKFGITYYTNLADRVPDFIDYLMIEAAGMKRLPEFSKSTFNHRAKTVIDDSGVVPLIRWLKHNSLSYPQIGKLLCTSKGNLESIRHYIHWLKTIHVKGRFLGLALVKAGETIFQRNIEELDTIVSYLENNGIQREWMGYVMSKCPNLLTYSMEEVKSRVEFFLDMGMNEKDFGTMVFDYPGVLGHFTLDEMNQKVSYLQEFGIDNEDVGRLLAFKPQLMGCSIEKRWKPLVKYFYYLGISRDGMRRILTIKPMVYCVDLETTIVPKVQFLQDLGIRDEAIGDMLVKFPPLLTYSLFKKIRPVVVFLMTKAGVSKKDISKVIAFGPQLLGCSIVNKLDVSVKFYLSLGIRLWQLGEMIADFPMLLRYNIELLRPKYRYLRRTMIRPLQDLIDFPRFFSYSLEDRIIPRYQVMVENRVNFKLRYMLASTDEQFNQRVIDAVERRRRFESGLTVDDPSDSNTSYDLSEDEIVFSDDPSDSDTTNDISEDEIFISDAQTI